MNFTKYTKNRMIRSAFYLLMLSGVANCNQFHSFNGSESDAHLSTNPVFVNPSQSFVGRDPLDDGLPSVIDVPNPFPGCTTGNCGGGTDNPGGTPGGGNPGENPGGGGGTDNPGGMPGNGGGVDVGGNPGGGGTPGTGFPNVPGGIDVPNPIPGCTTGNCGGGTPDVGGNPGGGGQPGTGTPGGGNPGTPGGTPVVDVDQPNPLPPFQWCGNGNRRFQVITADGQRYTRCRPCVTRGERVIDGSNVPVCEVQRCDGKNQYIFFGDNIDRPSRNCTRCDVLNTPKTKCQVVVTPPVVEPPRPPVVDVPNPKPEPPDRPRPPVTRGGDGGGDGGGDPLMIDSVGVQYASEDELRNSDASYFKSGDLDLTSPERGTKFNLLGQQNQTVLDSGQFLHINERGKNFEYQISWVQPHQFRYRFLALPNGNGHVLGIDQLFGDNTFGPDTHAPFAKDGFRALMKYDRGDANDSSASFADGYIDHNDAVYSKLRLWHDLNGDGNVNSSDEADRELVTLEQVGISYIHLVPNEKFFETDQYGNDIAYKSIVGFQSDDETPRLGTAFDMWFQYDPREVLQINGASVK